MNKVIICRGIQGSGKSTWAKAWVLEDPENRIRINNDTITEMWGEPFGTKGLYQRLKNFRKKLLEDSLYEGLDVVVDNMNLSEDSVNEIKSVVETFNRNTGGSYTIEFKDFLDVPLEVCLERNANRSNSLDESIIRKTYKTYRNKIASILNNNMLSNLKSKNPDFADCIIVDMDGTLCFNTTGRPFYGVPDKMLEDAPCENLINLVNTLSKTCHVIILTGRDESAREATVKWLENHKVIYDSLIMRKLNDFRSGDIVKKELYEQYVLDNYNVLFVLEDSRKCVDMWRKEGLLCLQPNNGNL